MPRIKIRQPDGIEQLYVDEGTLQEILRQTDDKSVKGTQLIVVGDINFIKRDFKGFTNDADPVLTEGYDLANEGHREEIKAFGNLLEHLEKTSELDQDISYYGQPTKTMRAGIVHNPVLGYVHWSEVAYAEREKLIGRYPQGNWFVALDPGAQKQFAAARRYDAYRAKKKALDRMKDYTINQQKEETTRLEGIDI